MNKRPLFLLTNDDGIHAPGIRALWEALKASDKADLVLIAPEHEKSGSGASITWDKPLLIKEVEWEGAKAWSVDGSPADCVKIGTHVILDRKPDLIVSGINAGSNAGRNVLHSGTVGAVVEGVFRGIPGVALSCENGSNPNFHVAQKYVWDILNYLFAHPLPSGSFLNVNFPQSATDKVKGFKLTRQGKGRWIEDPIFHLDTHKGPTYWLGGKPEESDEMEESDIHLLRQGYLTAVPIHIHELTDMQEFKKRQNHFETFFLC